MRQPRLECCYSRQQTQRETTVCSPASAGCSPRQDLQKKLVQTACFWLCLSRVCRLAFKLNMLGDVAVCNNDQSKGSPGPLDSILSWLNGTCSSCSFCQHWVMKIQVYIRGSWSEWWCSAAQLQEKQIQGWRCLSKTPIYSQTSRAQRQLEIPPEHERGR